jgi:hypothetical protein
MAGSTDRTAGTISWAEAETVKRKIEDQFSGKVVPPEPSGVKNIRGAIDVFITDKQVENLSTERIRRYGRELGRLASHCESRGVFAHRNLLRMMVRALRPVDALFRCDLFVRKSTQILCERTSAASF